MPLPRPQSIIRFIFFACVCSSIALMYHVHIVQQNYETFTLPDGPDTSDYFE